MKNKDVRRFVYMVCWMIIVLVAHIIGLKCCLAVGGLGNIIAGCILVIGCGSDALMILVEIVEVISGRKKAKEAYEEVGDCVNGALEYGVKAGKATVTKEEEEEE